MIRPLRLTIVSLALLATAGAAAAADGGGHSADVYGPPLAVARTLGIGPTMAARVVGDTLYTIGQGQLHVFDISRPAEPKLLGTLAGLGNTRQIAVSRSVAYVTLREHGVFIIDVAAPGAPKLLCHYDPIEVATGVDVSGDVLLVACRLHGVELVDVRDPRHPRHLAVARTGEAQSVAVDGGYAYVGVWGTSELVVVNVKNPRRPEITARCPLDGYGDGVAVHGGYVLVATGHHSRARAKSYPGPEDPGYGRGHGLEIFDLADPARPRFVSRIKMPPFYRIGMDMWSVKVAGRYAFVADTYNGLFVVDVGDPLHPTFVAHRQLPVVAQYGLPGVVGGLALGRDCVYLAGAWTDLEVVEAPGLARPVQMEPDTPPAIPDPEPATPERFRVYRPEGQVRSVDFLGDAAVVAAGTGGIRLVQLDPEITELGRQPTGGFAMKVQVVGERVFAAESDGGLSIWKRTGRGSLALEGRYQPRRGSVRDLVVHGGGRWAFLGVDMSDLEIVDVSDAAAPRLAFADSGHGFLYQIGEHLDPDGSVPILWQLDGLRWYDLPARSDRIHAVQGESAVPRPDESGHYERVSGRAYPFRLGGDGTVPCGPDQLVVYHGGLLRVAVGETRPPDALPLVRVPGCRLRGRPRRVGDRLYVADRRSGDVAVVDLSDPAAPKLVDHFNVPGNPAEVVLRHDAMVIPNGYEGLWVERTR